MDKYATSNNQSQPMGSPAATATSDQGPAGWSYGALLELHQRLQVSLQPARLLDQYFRWLESHLPVSGLEFVNQEQQPRIACGNSRQHSLLYVLELDHASLGEVTVFPKTRLPENQLAMLEHSLGTLALALHNALEHSRLEQLAFHDGLTGVMNRSALQSLLPKEVSRASRYQYPLSVVMIDLDKFKPINDLLGHAGGDVVLQEVAALIQTKMRDSDLCFRYGGDEFLLVFPGTDAEGATTAAMQIESCLRLLVVESGEYQITPGMSIGVASYQAGDSADTLIERADQAMYQTKRSKQTREITSPAPVTIHPSASEHAPGLAMGES